MIDIGLYCQSDLARSIFERRVSGSPSNAARALLAEVHLALGEVALESETYDKAVSDMRTYTSIFYLLALYAIATAFVLCLWIAFTQSFNFQI